MVKLISSKPNTLEILEAPVSQQNARPYLGMSGIGHSCSRALWYGFRWAYPINLPTRLLRLFSRGHREEPIVCADLERVGIECYRVDPEFGEVRITPSDTDADQEEMIAGFGHMKGHSDGRCRNVPEARKTDHLLEIKTINDKGFKTLCKQGIRSAKPVYYAQAQIYMRKLKLTRCLHVTVCKNDDAYYVERLRLDKGFADDLERKGESIILSEFPPAKTFAPTWWECKFCDARSICHNGVAMDKNCRTCIHIEIQPAGEWFCTAKQTGLSTEGQRTACTDHYQQIEG